MERMGLATAHYTIPRTVRELQHFGGEGRSDVIIPYQELLGNYNDEWRRSNGDRIIPYQELLGNYNVEIEDSSEREIIPYQELLGNYNLFL